MCFVYLVPVVLHPTSIKEPKPNQTKPKSNGVFSAGAKAQHLSIYLPSTTVYCTGTSTMMQTEDLFKDKQHRKKRGVLAPVKLGRSPKKDPRRKLTTWHPEDEEDFTIHPRRKTKWSPKRRQHDQPNNNDQEEHREDRAIYMKRAKTHTVNIFSSSARPLAVLEADAEVRRKYEKFSNASASLYAAKKLLEDESGMSDEAKAVKEEAGDGYKPYVPAKWIKEELEQRRALSAGKPTGILAAHYGHLTASTKMWRHINVLYEMISDPKFASKNMMAAASVNDALRVRLHKQGAPLAFANLAPLHWVSKDHFLCLLFAYYKFSPFQAHNQIGAVFDASLAERPYVEKMLFRGSPAMVDIAIKQAYAQSQERQKELLRLGTAVVNAVKHDELPQFIGAPIRGTRVSGAPSVLRVRGRIGGAFGDGEASMLNSGFNNGRPILNDSLKVNDRRVQNISNVIAGSQIDALRLQYPSRIDRRVIVSRLRLLEQPMATKNNIQFCMEVFEWDATGGCRVRDFVQIIGLPAMTESECQLAIAVREAMLQREQDVIMYRNAQEERLKKRADKDVFQTALLKAAAEAAEAGTTTTATVAQNINVLDKVHPFHFYLEFVSENNQILEEFTKQCVNRLTDDNRARVLNQQCNLTVERWNTYNDGMRRKKAMYYLVHRTSDKMLQKWKSFTKTQIKIRDSCNIAEEWWNTTYRKRALQQWSKWVPHHRQQVAEMKWAMGAYAQLVFKQMFRRWKSTTIIEKKLRLMQAERVRVEFEHAMKNLIRLMDRTVLRKVKASTFYSYSRWKQVVIEEIVFEKSVIWWRNTLARKAFNRLRDDAWEKINARFQNELDKNARQEEMMEAAREGERLAEEERQRILAERAAEAARLLAIEKTKQRYEDEMFAQRAAATRAQEQNTIRAYQREERLKQVKKEVDALESKHNGKWDSVEAGMCDKARCTAQELFETPKGKTRLLGIIYDMIEEIAANIKSKEERLACLAQNKMITPREGQPEWRVMYNEKEASRYWYNKRTEEEVYPEFLTEYTKKSKKKCKEMGMQLYADRKVVEARKLSLNLRNKAWDKNFRVYNAKRLSKWWRRMICRKKCIDEQWRADLQRFRTKKAKFHPAATLIQALARMWLAHPWLVYLVQDLQCITRVDDTKNAKGPSYWYNTITNASSWSPPTLLSKRLESRLQARKLLRFERVDRMGKKRRNNERKQAMIKAGLISAGKAGGGYGGV